MKAERLIFLVEEPSMEQFLEMLLAETFPRDSFEIHAFQGKPDLERKLGNRLRGFARWMPDTWKIIVLVDRDNDDCEQLKARLMAEALATGLRWKSPTEPTAWQVAGRIAIEELEAWFFGDWEAVRKAYPRVPPNVASGKSFREPDSISGGTWEAFERTLQRAGYFRTGLLKVEAARSIGKYFRPDVNRSQSFRAFWSLVTSALGSVSEARVPGA